MESELEKKVEEKPKKKMGKLEIFAKSYVFGLTAFTDVIGAYMHVGLDPTKADYKPICVSDIGFKYAADIKKDKGVNDYAFAAGFGYGAFSALALLVSTAGSPIVVTGLMDTTYGAYRHGKKALHEAKKKYNSAGT